jgi:hypothetical protein
MSHSSLSYYPAATSALAKHRRELNRPLRCRGTHDGYTLTPAGRQIRIGPVAFWIVIGVLVVMAV